MTFLFRKLIIWRRPFILVNKNHKQTQKRKAKTKRNKTNNQAKPKYSNQTKQSTNSFSYPFFVLINSDESKLPSAAPSFVYELRSKDKEKDQTPMSPTLVSAPPSAPTSPGLLIKSPQLSRNLTDTLLLEQTNPYSLFSQ
jgi:hypothetical protein